QPDHAVIAARPAHGASRAEDRTDRRRGPREVGDGAAGEVVREDLLDQVDDGSADDRGGVPRRRATRVCGEQFSYHAEDARERDRAPERPERTDRGLHGGREWGNSILGLPHLREDSYSRASFG